MKKLFVVVCILLVLPLTALAGWECNDHIPLGIPTVTVGSVNQLLCRDGYAVGYSYATHEPAWVAYRLTRISVFPYTKRSNHFKEDIEIPEDYRSTLSDYKEPVYDRGHLAPSASMDFSEKSMEESFLLSNMTPQLPGFNRRGWAEIEKSVRIWAKQRGIIDVVTGPLFLDGQEKKIGGVAVPSHFFKAVLDIETGETIAFLIPHKDFGQKEIPSFIVSVDQLEEATNMNLWPMLSEGVEANTARLW